MIRLKQIIKSSSIKAGPFGSDLKLEDYVTDGKFKVYTQENVISNNQNAGDKYVNHSKYMELYACRVKKGDILVSTRGTLGVFSMLNEFHEKGIIHSSVIKFRHNQNVNSRFLLWQLNFAPHVKDYIRSTSSVNAVPALYSKDICNIKLVNPSLPEQTSIANFLDHHVSRIDRQTNLLEQKAEHLEEYRQALIHESFSNLNKSKKVRFKDVSSIISGVGISPDRQGYVNGDIYFFRNSDFASKKNKYTLLESNTAFTQDYVEANKIKCVSKGCLVFSKIGESIRKNNRRFLKHKSVIDNNLAAFKLKDILADYFYWYTMSLDFSIFMVPSTVPVLDMSALKNHVFPLVDREQQGKVALHLNSETSKIDARVTLIRKKIELLKEYKQSLIYEAVTGKIDVNTYDAKAA